MTAFDELAENGFTVIPSVIPAQLASELRCAVLDLMETEKSNGQSWITNGNRRVFNLLRKTRVCDSLLLNPTIDDVVSQLLTADYLLSSLTANIVLPGNSSQGIHADQEYVWQPWTQALIVNCIWMLDDFLGANGATRVVPGSHLFDMATIPSEDSRFISVEGGAGSVLILDGRLWHGAGANGSIHERVAILANYCAPFIRQQENVFRSLPRDVVNTLPERVWSLLGFAAWNGLGVVDGPPLDWTDGRVRTGLVNSDNYFGPGQVPGRQPKER